MTTVPKGETSITTTTTRRPSKKKRFEGITTNDALSELLDEATKTATRHLKDDTTDDSKCLSSPSNDSVGSFPLSLQEASKALVAYQQQQDKEGDESGSLNPPRYIPIRILQCMAVLLGEDRVEDALSQGSPRPSLAYTDVTAMSKEETLRQKKYQQRMERLRQLQEERKYSKLTHNLSNTKVIQDDDVTTKSMTYAASIGLNMIVAPLSFGCFMYFFSGGVMDYFWKQPDLRPGSTDVRKVIVAVISGVVMLFIEMLLFVIRTHELDRALRLKSKKQKRVGPFGHYTSLTEKTYKDD